MGEQVLSDGQNDSKQQMATSTVAFGAVAIAADELIVWVGSTALATKNQVEIITGLQRCRDAIREAGSPVPGAGDEVVALTEMGFGKPAVVVTNQTALPTIAETDLLIGYGATYFAGGGKLLQDRINAAIEVFLEGTLKAA